MEQEFTADLRTAARARAFTDAQLARLGDGEWAHIAADASLIVSELVTNAVRAGSRRIRIAVAANSEHLEVKVSDDAAGWPVVRRAGVHDTGGRGLLIVTALATEWGVTAAMDGGKHVWARLALSRDGAPARGRHVPAKHRAGRAPSAAERRTG
jgi:anti-sigma regulatory factor (Ser/Thr protein kinase)